MTVKCVYVTRRHPPFPGVGAPVQAVPDATNSLGVVLNTRNISDEAQIQLPGFPLHVQLHVVWPTYVTEFRPGIPFITLTASWRVLTDVAGQVSVPPQAVQTPLKVTVPQLIVSVMTQIAVTASAFPKNRRPKSILALDAVRVRTVTILLFSIACIV